MTIDTLVALCAKALIKQKSPSIGYDWDTGLWFIQDDSMASIPCDLIEQMDIVHCDKCDQRRLEYLREYQVRFDLKYYRIVLCDSCWLESVDFGFGESDGIFRLKTYNFTRPSQDAAELIKLDEWYGKTYITHGLSKVPTIAFPCISHTFERIPDVMGTIIKHSLVVSGHTPAAISRLEKLFGLLETISEEHNDDCPCEDCEPSGDDYFGDYYDYCDAVYFTRPTAEYIRTKRTLRIARDNASDPDWNLASLFD